MPLTASCGSVKLHFAVFDFFHARVPVADFGVRLGQFVMAGIKKIFQHPEQIEIHESRMPFEDKWQMREHHFERQ